jgi:hypothetical protein
VRGSPKWVPKSGCPWPGLPSNRKCPSQLARHPHAKRWAPQWVERGVLGAPATSRTRERERDQAAPRRVTLPSLRRGVGQVESSRRERLMMDGKASKAVRSKFHSQEAHGVSSAVWDRERAGHEGQGTSPRPEHPVNLSWVSA